MILYFDTETTGKADLRAPLDAPHQPHIVQLAALLCDDDGKELQSLNVIIKPGNWIIPPEATEIHGISHDLAMQVGVSAKSAMSVFEWLCKAANLYVAHNIEFDDFVCASEFLRCFNADLSISFDDQFCTMKAMTGVCNIPGPYGPKWPKLIEAYRHCFQKDFDGQHDALADVRACKAIHEWIKKQEPVTGLI
jgi:DNA polymerase-3 subunit epsilon